MNRYIRHQCAVLQPFLRGVHTLLDFGCGDMGVDRELTEQIPTIHITGIDVVGKTPSFSKRLKFRLYDGNSIPFQNGAFDAVYAYHVFHHCKDPIASLGECKRVTKKRIFVVESVLRSVLELPGFMGMDYLANVGRDTHIPMPFHVHTYAWWKNVFRAAHLRVVHEISVGVFPTWLPIGKTVLFVLEV